MQNRQSMSLDNPHLQVPLPRPGRLIYAGELAPDTTADYRTRAFARLGQEVMKFDLRRYRFDDDFRNRLRYRFPFGPLVSAVNRDLLAKVKEFRPDVVFFDKPTLFGPDTIARIKDLGAKTVFYVQDGPFGPRNDGCWKQFYRAFRLADLHCLFRSADIPRYSEWNLPFLKILLSYEPTIHFAPDRNWSDTNRDRDVSYIGHPHEERAQFMLDLALRFKLPVSVSGNWSGVLTAEQQAVYQRDQYLLGTAYREGIWKSKINISFVTRMNEEDIGHKSMEIAACRGFLLALRTDGHLECFDEDQEAVFFSSIEECAEKARHYLAHPEERERIAEAGRKRAVTSGYSNDTQLARVLNYWG
jgi:spore maturation protein CgeB